MKSIKKKMGKEKEEDSFVSFSDSITGNMFTIIAVILLVGFGVCLFIVSGI
jgi:hypothetical protein